MGDEQVCERCGWPIAPWEQVVVAMARGPERAAGAPPGVEAVATFHKRHWSDGTSEWAKLGAGYAQRTEAA